MFRIETRGNWHEIGRQYGEALRVPLHECVEYFCPWLRGDLQKAGPFLQRMRALLEKRCPALLDETRGMAEGAALDETRMLAYRVFPDVAATMSTGCSLVYMGRSDVGPLLARNADLEKGISQRIQVCQVSRPTHGTPTITFSYVGLLTTSGFNAHGLGVVGASAHTTDQGHGPGDVPGAFLAFESWQQDRTTDEACARFAAERFAGKSCNLLVGDRQGASAVMELVPGCHGVRRPQPAGRDWNASTNTFLSGRFPMPDESEYQQCSYARYGRITQPFTDGQIDYSLAEMQNLMQQIAMPGPVCTGFNHTWKTAYSTVISLEERKVYLSTGHPAEVPAEAVTL